ncbi:hypothetical protein YC2023_018288 [Brassica napus]
MSLARPLSRPVDSIHATGGALISRRLDSLVMKLLHKTVKVNAKNFHGKTAMRTKNHEGHTPTEKPNRLTATYRTGFSPPVRFWQESSSNPHCYSKVQMQINLTYSIRLSL